MKRGTDAAAVFRTQLGWAGVEVSDKGVVRVLLPRKSRHAAERALRGTGERKSMPAAGPALLKRTIGLVARALSGEDLSLALPLDVGRYTQFQRDVWRATAKVPFGETRSYAWIARHIGRPMAARAVGQALGANPVPILIP